MMVETGAQENSGVKEFRPKLIILMIAYLGIWVSTLAHFMGDTNVYAQAILRHAYGFSDDYHQTTSNPFVDFGHLLWRPLGWLFFVIARPATRLLTHQNQRAEVILTLIGITFLASAVGVVVFFLLARRLVGDDWSALWASVGFFSADAFLNYAHTGNAYILGATCLVVGIYLTVPDKRQIVSLGRASLAGIFFALTVFSWFPYVFVLPAAMATPLLLGERTRERSRLVGQTIAVCVIAGLVGYSAAVAKLGIRNFADLEAWILAAGHGQIQAGGIRAAARLAFSFPRSFINMGRDGMWLKRYLVHDPYAPVTAAGIFHLSLWKLVIFYCAAGIVCFQLMRSERGRKLLMWLVLAVLPIIVFGVFLFQAGSIDLYLPLYPFVALAFGYVLGDGGQGRRVYKVLLLAALAIMVAVNVTAMSRSTLGASNAKAKKRIQDLIPRLGPKDVVMAINEQDSLGEFRLNFPLDRMNLDGEWQTYDMLEINAERLSTWREDFAQRVLATWQRGGAVWLPERVFHSQPNPDWNWVEGDDARVKWTDLPTFFSQLEIGPMVGGEDGFALLQNSPKNQQVLAATNQKWQAKGSR
ncbi:MAG: hypothetical protein WA412_18205 [Candidatus Sulfotelmatobacter sp.]